MTEQSTYQADPLAVWRERIFSIIFISTVLVGSVSLVSSLRLAIQEGHWSNVVLFILIYLWGVVIILVRRIPFKVRAWSGLFFFYVLGMLSFLSIGPLGSVRVYMFVFAVVASMLLGLRAGVIALVIDICTVLVSGWLMSTGRLTWGVDFSAFMDYWPTTSVTFLFLTTVVTVALALMVRGIENVLRKEKSLTAELMAANEQLDGEIAKRKEHISEQEAIVILATALRSALTRSDMFPIILDQVLDMLRVDGAAFGMRDPESGDIIFELARGAWGAMTGDRIPKGEGLSGIVMKSGHLYVSEDVRTDPRHALADKVVDTPAIVGVPLIAKDETIGVLWVGRTYPFSNGDQRLVTAIAEMAASAIRRASLHEETQRRVQRLNALHNIDKAISTDFDLNTILGAVLEQITSQLKIDAADILLYEESSNTFIYADGRGFYSDFVLHTGLRIGNGFAGRVALERRMIHIPDLLDVNDGSELPQAIIDEGFVDYCGFPLLAKGEMKGILELYYRNPWTPDQEWINFFDTLARQTAIAIDNASLFDSLQRSNLELTLAYDTTLEGWAKALELRDKETVGHAKRVVERTLELARALGMSQDEIVNVRRGALLHDIGKMGIPDRILSKPGPLSEEEWEIMRQHPVHAFDLLSSITFLRPALDIPYYHHEKWDGTGYPRGLKGEQIPLAARIFAIVDVWDALLSERPYRSAWPEEKVIEYIQEQVGLHFDPKVATVFLDTNK